MPSLLISQLHTLFILFPIIFPSFHPHLPSLFFPSLYPLDFVTIYIPPLLLTLLISSLFCFLSCPLFTLFISSSSYPLYFPPFSCPTYFLYSNLINFFALYIPSLFFNPLTLSFLIFLIPSFLLLIPSLIFYPLLRSLFYFSLFIPSLNFFPLISTLPSLIPTSSYFIFLTHSSAV